MGRLRSIEGVELSLSSIRHEGDRRSRGTMIAINSTRITARAVYGHGQKNTPTSTSPTAPVVNNVKRRMARNTFAIFLHPSRAARWTWVAS
jgi:hypothetical protein